MATENSKASGVLLPVQKSVLNELEDILDKFYVDALNDSKGK